MSDEIRSVLMRLWAAALDAKEMMAEPDATEEHYLAKQRHHIEKAEREIDRIVRESVHVDVRVEGVGGPGGDPS